jgi:cell division protein ZapA
MSHINVTINGRQYRMACEEGQEVRLLKLAETLESRVTELRGKFGEIGDARLTVMAALTVCDDLLDANARLHTMEQELESARNMRAAAVDRARGPPRSTLPPTASRRQRRCSTAPSAAGSRSGEVLFTLPWRVG